MVTARRLHLRVDERTVELLEYLQYRMNTPNVTALIQMAILQLAIETGWTEGWRAHD